MPSALQAAGSQSSRPTRFVPLSANRFFTGLWTQRNPLRDAATTWAYEKYFQGGRFDSLIDGLNTEISPRLTITRAPGSSVYNSQSFSEILQFYGFSLTDGTVQVIAQQNAPSAGVYNATGPSTKTLIASAASGTYLGFVTVFSPALGKNVLLFGHTQYDGTNTYQWGISDFFPQAPFAGLPSPDMITFTTAAGALSPTSGYSWVFEYFNSTTGDYSNASLPSVNSGMQTNKEFLLTAAGGTVISPAVADMIAIFRTLDGGSTYFHLTDIPNPGTGGFTYTDNSPDTALNIFQQAAVALENTAIPLGTTVTSAAYHLGVVWIAFGHQLFYSRTNNAILGNFYSSFPPANQFQFPHKIVKIVSNALGLFVFTKNDVHVILGNNTVASPLFPTTFLDTYGFQTPIAICQEGSLLYAYASSQELISIDPNAGISEVGFPIGDQFPHFTFPDTAFLTYHRESSGDKALYITSLAAGGWYRMAAAAAPENGLIWSPKRDFSATIGGLSAVQSVETSAGIRNLLIGPKTNGPILKRDFGTFLDNGVGYSSFATIGSLVLAQQSQAAELLFIGVEARKKFGGTLPSVSVVMDEPFPDAGMFEALPTGVADPPFLPPSLTYYGERFYFSQAADPAWCRHLQVKLSWPVSTAQTANDEIMSYSVIGAHWNEAS